MDDQELTVQRFLDHELTPEERLGIEQAIYDQYNYVAGFADAIEAGSKVFSIMGISGSCKGGVRPRDSTDCGLKTRAGSDCQ